MAGPAADHLWNVIPTIIFTVTAMTVLSELYHLFAKQLHLHWDTMKVVLGCSASLQKSQRVSTLSLSSPSRHFRIIPAIHRTSWKVYNFTQILQEKMISSIVLERWMADAPMLRESFHCLHSIDTNAWFARQGVVSRVLWLKVMYSWQYSFLLTSPPYQYHMAKKLIARPWEIGKFPRAWKGNHRINQNQSKANKKQTKTK